MKKLIQIPALILLFNLYNGWHCYSQNETKKWYFGLQAGLDFSTNPPTVLTNGVTAPADEAYASIADTQGNLLFYTNGVTVWNKTHTVMANGSGLDGNTSATQGALIVKQPGNNNLYFVFTLDAGALPNGLKYSVVDMALASGNGSVTIKNVPLLTPCTEKMAGVKHCNGIDTWVMVHDVTNVFKAYLVTSVGINTVAVNSAIGVSNANVGYLGSIKFSSNGKKLAAATSAVDSIAPWKTGVFELFDFDNATGIVSNPIILAKGYPTYNYAYACEFSPDCKKLYGLKTNTPAQNRIFQWDLCAGSASAIVSSIYSIATPSVYGGGMQLAPDGKIYISRHQQQSLAVINNPNLAGNASNYSEAGQSIAPKTCGIGLPSFVSSFLKPLPTLSLSVNCLTASFSPVIQQSLGCSASGNSLTGQVWSFGDPASGSSNTSTLGSPVHNYSTSGSYTAQLVLQYNCGSDTLRKVLTVSKCVGINALNNDKVPFLVYPNPVQNSFTLQLESSVILTIKNLLGETILEDFFEAGKNEINLEKENSGVYILCFKNDTGYYTRKLLKP